MSEPQTNRVINKKNLTVLSGLMLGAAFLGGLIDVNQNVITAFYLLSILAGGIFVLRSALTGLVEQRFLNINFLVAVAAIGAIYIGQYAEASAVVFFFMLAEFFEDFGVERSKRALEALVKKSPKIATLLNGRQIPVDEAKINDVVVVRPGDLIPLDAVVVKGESSVDEASITGESVPTDKAVDSTVFAGTTNLNGYLEVRVTKESQNSTFAKIIQLVDQAQRSRAPAQEFIDRFAKYYTPIVVVVAVLMATIPPLVFGAPFDTWLYRALVLLVIACPCALVIATPVAIASAIGGASRLGILIKGGKFLELLSRTKAVAFDKTKTLTYGEPVVTDVIPLAGNERELLALAAGLEHFSEHPLAKAIMSKARESGIAPAEVSGFEALTGAGAKGLVQGQAWYVGSPRLFEDMGAGLSAVQDQITQLQEQGKTVVLAGSATRVHGLLALQDRIRAEARAAIAALHALGLRTVMLTGDNARTAQAFARKLGIDDVRAELKPDDKVRAVEQLEREHGAVLMVGDGVNDAPALAAATCGMAMGVAGSDAAIEAADVALMADDLLKVGEALRLGRKARRVSAQNIVFSIAILVVMIPLAVAGILGVAATVLVHEASELLAVANGLRAGYRPGKYLARAKRVTA